jgi:EAL domain-containing protein (putative c-di-GMP-specific phosphodiesterase class I)/ActR/RegA family two-component response regulator
MSPIADATKSAYVLDDEHQIGAVLCQLLAAVGYQPRQFTDPQSFLVAVKSTPPGLIILDLALGQSDAVDVVRQLEILKYKGQVLLASGRDESILHKVKEIGVSRGLAMLSPLQKPFRAANLKSSLAGAVETRSAPSEGNAAADERSKLDLGEALHNRWLELWYQPKIDLDTMTVAGAEALLRARHPQRGILIPADILPPPADPLYQPLTEFVIGQALVDWKYFADRNLILKLSVNIPISVMQTGDFITSMRNWLPKDPRFPGLIVEVTEDEVTREAEWIQEIAVQLKLINVALSIDDFGAGYSSLSRLRDLPCVELKLDRSFVDGCALDGGKQSLCNAAIELAHGFGVSVCAEGVENIDDLRALIAMRCDVAQGYLFAKPMPSEVLIKFLSGQSNGPIDDTTPQASTGMPLARSA